MDPGPSLCGIQQSRLPQADRLNRYVREAGALEAGEVILHGSSSPKATGVHLLDGDYAAAGRKHPTELAQQAFVGARLMGVIEQHTNRQDDVEAAARYRQLKAVNVLKRSFRNELRRLHEKVLRRVDTIHFGSPRD